MFFCTVHFKKVIIRKQTVLNKLIIFGVGLIGGSVALALKKNSVLTTKAGFSTHVIGVGRSTSRSNHALKLGVIDEYFDVLETSGLVLTSNNLLPSDNKKINGLAKSNLAQTINNANIILIAAPVAQTASILQTIKPHLNKQTVITDAGSTKGDVLACASIILGSQNNQFVGGHPIAGAEKSGVTAATSNLFIGKNVVLTPGPETSKAALALVTALWQACGAHVSEMAAQKHDEIFATVSHLPHLLAFALVDEVASRPNATQLFSYAASGFRDFTRIAGSHPEMWRDISLANKEALLEELNAYQNNLNVIKQLLENENGQALEALFERASMARNNWAKQHKIN